MISRADTSFLSRVDGPETVRDYFRRCRARGRLAHAYLFTGPSGCGKEEFAHGLAKALLCPGGEPCCRCSSCRAIEDGNHAAYQRFRSGEGKASMDIAEVRKLAQRDRRRRDGALIWVVEEVQRLSQAAMNALLKTLEEPGPGALLLLLAPSAGTLLPTIVSRCHRVRFPAPAGPEPVDGADRWRLLRAPARRDFYARNEPRAWLEELVPEAGGPREALEALLDELVRRWRVVWPHGEADHAGIFADPLLTLEALLDLRSDIDRNVNVDLVLEALVRQLGEAPLPGVGAPE